LDLLDKIQLDNIVDDFETRKATKVHL